MRAACGALDLRQTTGVCVGRRVTPSPTAAAAARRQPVRESL